MPFNLVIYTIKSVALPIYTALTTSSCEATAAAPTLLLMLLLSVYMTSDGSVSVVILLYVYSAASIVLSIVTLGGIRHSSAVYGMIIFKLSIASLPTILL